jgi:diacylglycerol kinase family enzyme
MRLDLEIDGVPRRVRTPSLTVTVNLLGDGGARQFGRDRLDGGQLGIYVFRRLGLREALRVGVMALLGHWHRDDAVEVLSARELTLRSTRPALRVMLDGEAVLMRTPLRFRVRPGGLQVVAPAPEAAG